MGASALALSRAGKVEAELTATIFDERQEDIAQRQRLALHQAHVDAIEHRQRVIERGHGQDRRCAAQEALHALGRAVAVVEIERGGVPHPAGERRLQFSLQAACDIQKSRRTRPAIEELVPAANRKIRVATRKVDRDRARAVAEVPQHQRTVRVRGGGDRGHVVPAPGLVVDVGQEDERGVIVDGVADRLGGFGPHPAIRHHAGDALRDVEVGREIARLGQDRAAVGSGQANCRDQLEQVHRNRIADDHFVGRGADQRCDPRADPLWQADPVVLVPACDQVRAPLRIDHRVHGRARGVQRGPKRIAVEVGHPRGQGEALSQWRQRVCRIEAQGFLFGHDNVLSTARTGAASSPASASGKAINS